MFKVYEDANGGVYQLTVFSVDLTNGNIVKEATFEMDEGSLMDAKITAADGILFVRYGAIRRSSDPLVILMDSSTFELI